MSSFWLTATMAVATMAAISLARAAAQDRAHTLFTPKAPDPSRAGVVVQLPQGGSGITTGGTAGYQTLATPNGSAIVIPNRGGTSAVFGSGNRTGIINTPR